MACRQHFLLALGVLFASVVLQGCNDQAELDKTRDQAKKEGEAAKGLSDAVGEYKHARDEIKSKKESLNEVLSAEGRDPEQDEATMLKEAEEILKEGSAAASAEKDDGAKSTNGGSSLLSTFLRRKTKTTPRQGLSASH
eukprot:gb/GFBE01041952.1/.p1 GENE.gb/GFBE01041952.1/~~gb/GFBE01041952.1/.p1  ORF type:complete len:139 (+),score=41.40 gb/GFBE01041952.1/:1-417(+)